MIEALLSKDRGKIRGKGLNRVVKACVRLQGSVSRLIEPEPRRIWGKYGTF